MKIKVGDYFYDGLGVYGRTKRLFIVREILGNFCYPIEAYALGSSSRLLFGLLEVEPYIMTDEEEIAMYILGDNQ